MNQELSLTQWIRQAADGQPGAAGALFERLYPELRRMAHARLFAGGGGVPLCTTELVHESFLRLAARETLDVTDRRHFFTYAARVMRSVVVDLVREHRAQRRGGGAAHLDIDALGEVLAAPCTAADELLLRVHEALDDLEQVDPQLARIVEMQYFAGYSQVEVAELVDLSERQVRRQWDKARAFLMLALKA